MKKAIDEIVEALSSLGYRITQPRKEVIAALIDSSQPLTIQSLCAVVTVADEASVYRTIRMLVEEGLAEEIVVANQAPSYALAHGHHHHAVCTTCGFMDHVECAIKHLATPCSFTEIDTHDLTLYGLCKKCS